MAMIRPQRDVYLTTLFHFKQSLHHFIYVNIAFQQVCLEEIALGIPLGAPQMNKTDTITELTHHRRTVIIRTYSERTCAETQTIGRIWNSRNQLTEIFSSGKNTWKTKNRIWRIVRVNYHDAATLICNRTNLLKEENQILP
jgi:hypothetical protein